MKTDSGAAPVQYQDYYHTLGVTKDASAEDIKKAYRKMVRKYHPDVSKAADADRKTKEINEAYAVLGDPEKRAAYDALGRAPQGQPFQPPPDWSRNFDFSGAADQDFFADLFAHVGRRGQAQDGQFAMRGEDIHAQLLVDLADAYHGATRSVSLRIGQRERSISVNIPKGVLPGQQLRLSGQGQPGAGGAGDLYLEIAFRPDARYRVDERQVFESVPVTPWEAALGAHIDVPTPSGTVRVTVPAGSQSGRKLRLKGRGIPANPPGDLYLILEVVLPPASSEKARDLYLAMAREMPFNPRAQARA